MITLEEALTRHTFYHVTLRYKTGAAYQARANGGCKTWKRDTKRFRLPIRIGFKSYDYIDNDSAQYWLPYDPTEADKCPKMVGLNEDTPWQMVMDRLLEMGKDKEAKLWHKEMIRRGKCPGVMS